MSTETSPTSTVRRTGAFATVFLGVGLMLVALNLRLGVASVGPVLTFVEDDLHVSSSTASLLTTIPVFAFGAFAFLTPVLTRRFGLHRLLGVTMLALTAGIAVRLEPSAWALYGGTVLVGASIAVANVLMPAAIKQDFADRVGLMTGLYSTALFVSAALASAFTVPLVTAAGGAWRPALAFWAVPAVIAFVVWLPQALRRRAATARPDGAGTTRPGRAVTRTGTVTPSELGEPRFVRLLRDRVALAVTALMGLQSLGYYVALTWVPTILQDAGVSAHDAGVMLSTSALPGVVGALVGPAIARRVRPVWLPIVVACACTAVGLVGLAAAPADGAWVWMTFLGLGQGGAISLSLSYIVWRSPDAAYTAHLSTLAQGVGYLLAGLGPVGIGLVHTVTGGWVVPIVVLLALLGVQVVAGVAASRERQVLAPR